VLVHARECAKLSCLVVLTLSAQLQWFELHHPVVRRESVLSTERYRVINGWQSIFELRSDEGVIVQPTLHLLSYSSAIILGQCLDKATDKKP
jgi:hypothetical protein